MGTDFLRNKRERHTKAWRHGLARTEGDWIADAPRVTRVFRAKAAIPCSLAANQPVVLRLVANNAVVASAGIHEVATLIKPSAALVTQLTQHHGVGAAKVQRVSNSSDRVDLLVED
jgi:hypothetical protein